MGVGGEALAYLIRVVVVAVDDAVCGGARSYAGDS
jgi:hypothetical protein